MKQEIMGWQWTTWCALDSKPIICTSLQNAPRFRKTPTSAPYHLFFTGRMLFVMPN